MKKLLFTSLNPCRFLVKMLALTALALIGIAKANLAQAQCTNSSAYGSAVAPTGTGVTTISTCSYLSEYSTISSVVAGNRYVVTNSAAGSFITIRFGTSNGTVVAAGFSPLQFTAPCAGTYYAHWNTNSACGTASGCTTTTISCASCGATNGNQCSNASQFGTATAPTAGTTTISTCSYASEYSTVNSVVAGSVYRLTSSVATDFITVRQGSPSGTVIASGQGPLTWTSTVAGTYFCHWSANAACGVQNACRTTTITYVGVGPCSGCSGTPAPGNTLATFAAVPVGATTTLSLQNPTGTGALYQWQSGPSSTGPWTNITGATGTTYLLTYATPTWYRCVVTCGVNAGTSNPIQITTGPCISTSFYGAGFGYYGMINSVNFNTLSHTGTGALAAPYYASYPTSATTTTVMAGVSYNLTLNTGLYNAAGAWFDWNNNSVFEASEYVSFGTNTTFTNWSGTVPVTVPNNAFNGQVAMRVRTEYAFYTFDANSACSTLTYGETKDFRITVIPAPNCTGTPNAGVATISAATGCPNQSITLSTSGLSIGNGISYQWQSGPSATGPWANITGATSSTFTTATTTTTHYRLVTACLFTASSNNSNVVSFTPSGGQCQCGTYPAVFASSTADEEISNVTVGTMNNSSNCATTAPGPGSINSRYSNYTGSISGPSVNQGDVVNFSVTQTSCGGPYNNIFQIFVDFNQDGDFLDAGEFVYNQPVVATGNHTKTGSFLVPSGATLGTTRMRVVNIESFTTTVNYAHSGYTWGETEDYCFTVTLPPPCAGTPTPGNTIATPNSVFAGQTTVLTLQNNTSGTGVTYQWQSAPSATGPWSNITGGTSFTFTATPTATTWYQCVVTCTNSASSATSTPVLVNYNPYCNPVYSSGTLYGDLISNVAITGTTLNNNSGTAAGGPYYTYYSNLPAAVMQAATSYQVQVTAGSFSGQNFAVWIDYNDNFIFEASEKVGFTTAGTTTSFQTVSFNINLACTPPLGLHRMRVRGVWLTAGASIDPCALYGYGETEDYNVNIIAAVPFTPSFTVAPGNQACTFTDYTYATQAGMQSYTWGFPGTAGVNYNIISGGTSTSNTATVQYLTAGTQTVSINYLNASGCTSTGPVNTSITVQGTAQIAPLAGTQTVCAGATVNFSTASTGGTWTSSNTAVATVNPNTGVVTGVAAGTATMTYTITNPTTWCPPSTATRTVTVIPSPIVNAGNDVTICSGQSTNLAGSVTPATVNGSCTQNYSGGGNDCSNFFIGGISNCAPAGAIITSITYQAVIGPYCTSWYNWILFVNGAQITTGCNGTFTYNGLNGQPANGQLLQLRSIDNDFYCDYVNMQFNVTINYTIPVNFSWAAAPSLTNTTSLTPSASPMQTTTYTLSSTNSLGCTASDQVVVNVNQSPANAPIVAPAVLCVGNNAVVSNPVPNGTWSSSTPALMSLNAVTGDIVGMGAGTAAVSYTTTATNGCTTTTNANIAVQALPVATITSSNGTSICQGSATTLSAPTAASYAWNNGATTQSISVTAGGNYAVTITSAAGCVSNPSAPMSLTVNQPPVATVALNGPATFCQGGSVVLTAAGGTTYNWNNSISAAANTITTSGTYTATVTNAAGCTATTAPITVNVLPAPAASISANGPTAFCAGGSVVLSANGAGSYLWSNGSTASSVSVNTSASLTYTVTDANGCSTTTAPTVVAVTALPTVAAIAGANTVCQGANTNFTNASNGGVWSSSNAAVASVDATGVVSGITGGNATISYTVTNNGCSTTVVKNISVQTAPATSISVSGPTTFCAGGSVVLTAASGTGYNWTNSATSQSITVTTSGTYNVEVTNGLGCVSTATSITVDVLSAAVPVVTTNNVAICQGSSATLTASPAAAYLWSNGSTTPSINASTAGNYSVTITDANGCSATSAPLVIAVSASPSVSIAAAGSTTFCQGQSVVLNTNTNATSLQWSNGALTPSITASTSGIYFVTATNAAGCSSVSNEIIVNAQASFTPTITAVSPTTVCAGAFATLVASPGATYLWSNNANTQGVNIGTNGPVTVTVTNSQGCTGTSAPINITVLPVPTTTITASGPTTFCEGGSVTLTAGGANSYIWANNSTAASQTVTSPGTYVVTGYSANGCPDLTEITITVNEAPSTDLIADGNNTLCPGEILTLSAQPGNTYNWAPTGSTAQEIAVSTPGTYSCAITSANGCTTASEQVIVTAALPTSTTLNVTAVQNYVLNEITYTQSGTYTQVLTNAAGCDSTITLNLTLTVGLDENGLVSFSVQPNPTDAIFTLKASEALFSTYVIQDAQGKVVSTGTLTGTSTTIDIEQVARGIYFLKVAETAEAIRIVKN